MEASEWVEKNCPYSNEKELENGIAKCCKTCHYCEQGDIMYTCRIWFNRSKIYG